MEYVASYIPPFYTALWADTIRTSLIAFAAAAAASSAANKRPLDPLYQKYFWRNLGYTFVALVLFWTIINPMLPIPL